MLESLMRQNKVIGLKQSRKAIVEGIADSVFIACDAEERVIAPIKELCRANGIKAVCEFTMIQLGEACGIEVGAAVVAVLKN